MKPEILSYNQTRHLKIHRIRMFAVGLWNIYDRYAPRYCIEHNEMSKQLHFDEIVFFAMELDAAKSILKFPEAGFYVPTLMIHLLHTLYGELESIQICNENFPFFFAAVRVVNLKLDHTECIDKTLLLM